MGQRLTGEYRQDGSRPQLPQRNIKSNDRKDGVFCENIGGYEQEKG